MSLWSSEDRFPWWAVLAHDPLPIGGIAVALTLGTYTLLRIPPSVPLLVVGFCGAALIYGIDRAVVHSPEDTLNHPDRRRWVQTHQTWLRGEAVVLLIVGSVAIGFLRWHTLLAAGGLTVLAGLHLVRVGGSARLLRTWGVGKPLVVAGTWTIGATLLPVLEAGKMLGPAVWALAGYRMLFVLPNVLMADWGDRRGDATLEGQTWAAEGMGQMLRWAATAMLGLAIAGAGVVSTRVAFPLLLLVDAVGPLLLLVAVWTLRPATAGARLVMDGLVAWPLVTAFVAWSIGVWPG